MACSTGMPWQQMVINWHEWPWTFFQSQVSTSSQILSYFAQYPLYTATSTDTERAFSRGGLTVSKMRHSLSDQSTRTATVLGAWCDLPGAVP